MRSNRAAEVFPPGKLIKDELAARDWSLADLAKFPGCPAQAVIEIIAAEKPITPEIAQGLGVAFGTGTQFWLNLENTYRLSTRSTEGSGDPQ